MKTMPTDSSLAQHYQITINRYFDTLNQEQFLETAAALDCKRVIARMWSEV
jgi:hypothetical protein